MGIVQVYNGQVAEMRKEGHTLQQIGDATGVSRERVRQVLERYYPDARTSLLNELQAAKLLGCPDTRLRQLRKRGVIKPKRMGWLWRYSREDLEKAMLALQRFCPHCGMPVTRWHAIRYCAECGEERQKNPYSFMSDEAKQRFRQRVAEWREHNSLRL